MENKFIRADDVAQELSVSKPYPERNKASLRKRFKSYPVSLLI